MDKIGNVRNNEFRNKLEISQKTPSEASNRRIKKAFYLIDKDSSLRTKHRDLVKPRLSSKMIILSRYQNLRRICRFMFRYLLENQLILMWSTVTQLMRSKTLFRVRKVLLPTNKDSSLMALNWKMEEL